MIGPSIEPSDDEWASGSRDSVHDVLTMTTLDHELLRNCSDGVTSISRCLDGWRAGAGAHLMEKTTLGQALVERRIELAIDKGRAAAMIGVTRATYAAYESDSRRLAMDGLPALRTFLGVSVEDFLELYGATCVAQARVTLMRDLFVGDIALAERPAPTTMLVKNVRDDELSVVERVFFDVVTAEGHGVASPFVTQQSTLAPTPRAPTSSVLGRLDQDGIVTAIGEVTDTTKKAKKAKTGKKRTKEKQGKQRGGSSRKQARKAQTAKKAKGKKKSKKDGPNKKKKSQKHKKKSK